MLRWDTVESAHMTLGLVPEIFDAIDVVVTIGKELGMVDPEVMEVRHIQHIVTTPAVGIDDTIGPTLRLMMGINVAPDASGMIFV